MVALTQKAEAANYFPKCEIYGERIGKSFGDDRIEHMNRDKQYMVEKSGKLAEMEHFRDSVFYGVAAGAAVWFFLFLMCIYRKKD